MINYTEYSSKATAVRGAKRMGATEDMLDTVVVKGLLGKWLVSPEQVSQLLIAKRRGDAVVAGADKSDVADAAIKPTAAAVEQMTQSEIDVALAETCGYSHCPTCGVHLSNGLLDFDTLEEQHGKTKAYSFQKHEWACMACSAEWGAEIPAPAKRVVNKTGRRYENRAASTVEKPSEIVFRLADAEPEAARKDVVAKAVAAGVTINTANAAYQHWRKARGLAKTNA